MITLSPAVRLSLGLVLLTLSILMMAQFIGLTPTGDKQQLLLRQQQSESLALRVASTIEHDYAALDNVLKDSLARHKVMNSIGVRGLDGQLLSLSEGHKKYWAAAPSKGSNPSFIRLPVYISNHPYALLEISFSEKNHGNNWLGLSSFVSLALFLALSGFIGYWLFIKRALKHLDPSAVVPARVRNALNILSEGVLILDQKQQVVLANSAMMEELQRSEKQLFGRNASKLGWQIDPKSEERDFPWEIALNTGETRRGVRMLLDPASLADNTAPKERSKQRVFQVNAVPIQDDGGNRQGTIVSFDDVSDLEEKNSLLEDLLQQVSAVQASLEKKNRELGYLASRDPLTGCFNRRALYEYLDNKFSKAIHAQAEFTCIMSDIDHFKNVNDTYGHSVGDEIIKMVANSIQESLREGDIVARYGGEEFCIILPRTPLSEACIVADRCRETIAAQNCEGVKVTSSFGVSSIEFEPADPQALITQADEALYLSKESGRNCVHPWNSSLKHR